MGQIGEGQARFELSGGAACLDFANTLGDRPIGSSEKLRQIDDLLQWSLEAGLVDRVCRARLAGEVRGDPGLARAFLRRAIELRERIYRIFAALAAGRRPDPRDLDELNGDLGAAGRHLRVEPRGGDFVWSWAAGEEDLDRLLWPVVRSAAELLTSPEVRHVRECASERCSWLFVDRSRTRRRRWCDMKVCGNRAKAQRHYRRRRGAAPS